MPRAWRVRRALDEFDAARRPKASGDGNGYGSDENARPQSAHAKARAAREALREKVAAQQPSLMERLDVASARDRAKARALRALGQTLRAAYGGDGGNEAVSGGGASGGGGGGKGWVALALADDMLTPEEAEFLSMTAGAGGEMEEGLGY